MHQSPAETMLITQVVNPALYDDTAVNGAGVDMQGWDGVLFLIPVGAMDTTLDAKAQDSADNSTFADIAGAAITQYTATDDNKLCAIDVWRPTARFVRVVVDPGDGTLGVNTGAIAIRYRRTGKLPVTQAMKELVKKAVN